MVVGVRQWHLGQRMQSICQLGGSVGERAGACLQGRHPGASAPARLHIRTRLASRKGIDSNLFHGLMFLICVYLFFRNIAQGSGNLKHSISRRGVRALGGGEAAMPFGAAHAAYLSARGGARGRASLPTGTEHKHAHWRVRTRAPARPATPRTQKIATTTCTTA